MKLRLSSTGKPRIESISYYALHNNFNGNLNTMSVTKVTGGKWVRTRLCGCGECSTKPGKPTPCPMENEPKATWLWGTEYTGEEDQVPTVDSDGVEIDSWD